MKVELTDEYYFVVFPLDFHLYKQTESAERPGEFNSSNLGYFTSIQRLVRRVVQAILSKREEPTTLIDFLKQWKELQEELLVKIPETLKT